MQDLLTNLVVFITLTFAVVATIDFVVGLARLANSVAEQAIAPPLASQATASADLHQQAQAIAPDPTLQAESEPATANDLQRYPILELLPVQSPPVEDPWLIAVVSCTNNCCQSAIAAEPPLPLAPDKDSDQPVAVMPVKTTKPKRKKAKASATNTEFTTLPTHLAQMKALELRKLCTQKNIQWRNVHGKGKHLAKIEMLEKLTAERNQAI